MKAKEIRDLSTQELEKNLRDKRGELLQLRLRKNTGQLENSHLLTTLRRDIARLETIRRQKTVAASA